MDFIKRKVSRFGYTLCHYKVMIRPISLELTIDQPGEVWVQLKRGRHKEKTQKHRVESTAGFGRQNVQVNFAPEEVLVRISDFYRNKEGNV
jgi:hypothetical protein